MNGSRRAFLVAAGAVGAVAGGVGTYPGAVAGEPTDRVTVGTGMAALDDVAAAVEREEAGAGLETVETEGFEAFLDGRVDVQHAARPMSAEERERATETGLGFEERELPVGGVAALEASDGWSRCLSEEERAGFDTGVEVWSEVVSGTGVKSGSDLPDSGADVLVRGTRAVQYAIGHGGVAYHEASPSAFESVDGSGRSPVVRLGFTYVDRDALGHEALATLLDAQDDAASDVTHVPSED